MTRVGFISECKKKIAFIFASHLCISGKLNKYKAGRNGSPLPPIPPLFVWYPLSRCFVAHLKSMNFGGEGIEPL